MTRSGALEQRAPPAVSSEQKRIAAVLWISGQSGGVVSRGHATLRETKRKSLRAWKAWAQCCFPHWLSYVNLRASASSRSDWNTEVEWCPVSGNGQLHLQMASDACSHAAHPQRAAKALAVH